MVARPSVYGSPFRVGVDGNPAECVAMFRAFWEAALAENARRGRRSYAELPANLRERTSLAGVGYRTRAIRTCCSNLRTLQRLPDPAIIEPGISAVSGCRGGPRSHRPPPGPQNERERVAWPRL